MYCIQNCVVDFFRYYGQNYFHNHIIRIWKVKQAREKCWVWTCPHFGSRLCENGLWARHKDAQQGQLWHTINTRFLYEELSEVEECLKFATEINFQNINVLREEKSQEATSWFYCIILLQKLIWSSPF